MKILSWKASLGRCLHWLSESHHFQTQSKSLRCKTQAIRYSTVQTTSKWPRYYTTLSWGSSLQNSSWLIWSWLLLSRSAKWQQSKGIQTWLYDKSSQVFWAASGWKSSTLGIQISQECSRSEPYSQHARKTSRFAKWKEWRRALWSCTCDRYASS